MMQQKETFSAINLYKFALLALIFGFNVSQPLLAAEMPCVKEVCIGDDLNKLRGIKFQPVDESRVARVNKRKQTNILNATSVRFVPKRHTHSKNDETKLIYTSSY